MMLTMPWWALLVIVTLVNGYVSAVWLWYHRRVVRWWANYAQEADDLADGWRHLYEDTARVLLEEVTG